MLMDDNSSNLVVPTRAHCPTPSYHSACTPNGSAIYAPKRSRESESAVHGWMVMALVIGVVVIGAVASWRLVSV